MFVGQDVAKDTADRSLGGTTHHTNNNFVQVEMTDAASEADLIKAHEPPVLTQLTALLCWNGLYLIPIISSLLVLSGPFIYPPSLYFIIPYITYTLVLRRDELNYGNPWQAFSRGFPLFHTMRDHLGLEFSRPEKELVKAEAMPDAQFVFAVFPHGTSADYRILMDGILYEVLPNIHRKCRTLAASVLFRIPIVREMSLWTGCIDARRSVAENVLEKGMSILVLPGGMAEQLMTDHGREIVYLKKRKGFVKLAMKKGVPLVPVYVFGCSDMFYTSHFLFKFRSWLMKSFGFCIPLAAGLGGTSCPLSVKTTVVMGKPLTFESKEKGKPTEEELNNAHDQFSVALRQLFDEHKGRLGYGDRSLEMM